MKTTINNNERVFLLKTYGQSVFCNLKDVPRVYRKLSGTYEVELFHFWNFTLRKLSKKQANELLKSNRINFKIN